MGAVGAPRNDQQERAVLSAVQNIFASASKSAQKAIRKLSGINSSERLPAPPEEHENEIIGAHVPSPSRLSLDDIPFAGDDAFLPKLKPRGTPSFGKSMFAGSRVQRSTERDETGSVHRQSTEDAEGDIYEELSDGVKLRTCVQQPPPPPGPPPRGGSFKFNRGKSSKPPGTGQNSQKKHAAQTQWTPLARWPSEIWNMERATSGGLRGSAHSKQEPATSTTATVAKPRTSPRSIMDLVPRHLFAGDQSGSFTDTQSAKGSKESCVSTSTQGS